MSISKQLTNAVLAASLAAGCLAPLSTSALAGDWNGRHYARDGYRDGYRDHRDWRVEPDRRFRGFEQYRRGDRDRGRHHADVDRRYRDDRYDHHDRRDERMAKGVAIGLGVLMLGAIIANADRH